MERDRRIAPDDDGSLLDRIDQVCERFEEAWRRADSRPSLSEHLSGWTGVERRSLFGHLLELELEIRLRRDELPDVEEYANQFPDYVELIREKWNQQWGFLTDETGDDTESTIVGSGSNKPTSLGKYRVSRKLGAGSFGTVYLAYDEELERHVAIKVPKRTGTATQIRRLRSEARKSAALNHRSIVGVIDVDDSDDDRPFIVMQYVAGCSLKKLISKERLSWATSAQVVIEIAGALEHAHAKGFVHRDLKPANILIDEQWHPFIADFGLAFHVDEGFAQAGEIAGSLQYMAPEQVRGETHEIGPATDVWALCVIFYELLTGKRPFDGSDPDQLVASILTDEVTESDLAHCHVPDSIRAVCVKGLSRQPSHRFESAQELSNAVQAARDWETQDKSRRIQRVLQRSLLAGIAVGVVCWIALWSNREITNRVVERERLADQALSQLLESTIDEIPSRVEEIQKFLDLVKPRLTELTSSTSAGEQLRASLSLLPTDASQVESLYERLLDSSEEQFPLLLSALHRHDRQLPERLARELELHAQIQKDVEPPALEVIAQSQGLATRGSVFCQTMPLAVFPDISRELAKSGFGPIRFRPFSRAGTTLVAAIWSRSNHEVKWLQGLRADEVVREDERMRDSGWEPIDVACYEDEQGRDRYCGLWRQASANSRRHVVLAIGESVYPNDAAEPSLGDRQRLVTMQSSFGASGVRKLCGVADVRDGETECLLLRDETYPDFYEWLPRLQTETTIRRLTGVPPVTTQMKRRLGLINHVLSAGSNAPTLLMHKAHAGFYLGEEHEAIKAVSHVIDEYPDHRFNGYSLRARAHARLGMSRQAQKDLEKCLAERLSTDSPSFRRDAYDAWLTTLVSAQIGDTAETLQELEQVVESHAGEPEFLIYAACVYAEMSTISPKDGDGSSSEYATRALALLRLAIEHGFTYYDRLKILPELAPLRKDPDFWSLIPDRAMPGYGGLWEKSKWYESTHLFGMTPDHHLTRAHSLAAQGFLPRALSVLEIGDQRPLVTASVWHRLQDDAIPRLVRAAIALIHLDQANKVWPLLKGSRDSRLRTLFINRLATAGVPPETIGARLANETDPMIRQGLILSLGEYSSEQLAPTVKQTVINGLRNQYKNDPHAGVHGACGWLLRQWGQDASVAEMDKDGSTGSIVAGRDWYMTRGGQTMTIVRKPDAVWASGPRGPDQPPVVVENLIQAKVDHDFAIATTEVTLKQFQRFDESFRQATEANAPVVGITWFRAAEYCNWLSRENGTPEFYHFVHDGEAQTVRLPLTGVRYGGYRLPTELEWELACRAGIFTNPFSGAGRNLIDKYSWHAGNAKGRVRPVGLLKPNGWGIFDGLGNCLEYCQNRYDGYRLDRRNREITLRSSWVATEEDQRAVRGASAALLPSEHRMGFRVGFLPNAPRPDQGFRVARTLN